MKKLLINIPSIDAARYTRIITGKNTDPQFRPSAFFLVIIISMIFSLTSCKKFLEIDPPKSKVESSVAFNNDAAATSAVLGIYSELMSDRRFASGDNRSVLSLAGLSADELDNFPNQDVSSVEFETNALTPANSYILDLWTSMYKAIYQSNLVIEGLNNTTGVSGTVKSQLQGEAYFIRAFSHFYLVNLFGDVPLILTTDYQQNAKASRTAAAMVYEQIVKDLLKTQELLGEEYVANFNERIRPNKSTATAMLARVYLYQGKWSEAETQATGVISNTSMYSLNSNPLDVFNMNSTEAIWQLRPVAINGDNGYTWEAYYFSPSRVLRNNVFRDTLIKSFEAGDLRKSNWVDSLIDNSTIVYFPRKYKQDIFSNPLTEYSMVIRLAEQYLIRAEARAQLNNISGSQADINIIRNRAFGFSHPTTANDKNSLLVAIEQERKVEFFAEWGHRWLDLKRWNRANTVLASQKGTTWQSTDILYPLPESEMNKNFNLKPQNPGY